MLFEDPMTVRAFDKWSMRLIRRDDMAEEMRELHMTGAYANRSGREVMVDLMRWLER